MFKLDPAVAGPLIAACDELIDVLNVTIGDAHQLGSMHGFGTLGSGQALQAKFEQKAVGGPDALVEVLRSHIVVVETLQAQLQACIDNALDHESLNASNLTSIDLPN
ncbi:hypothetical protein [Rhodococcus erythropolis]|uniref:hypothetical protein n=1 Tax=Rhodococcus erythropolis TaxID=1833 RepID=UPI001BEB5A91|nr:hypothetical protein [Rhodococcus erythropolis]MBT2269196.1 hypothetical protein [Rhodococcus erythropolis]